MGVWELGGKSRVQSLQSTVIRGGLIGRAAFRFRGGLRGGLVGRVFEGSTESRPTIGLLGFGFAPAEEFEVVVVFAPGEMDGAAPIVGVLELGEFVGDAFEAGEAEVGVFDGFHVGEGLADFDDDAAAEGFEGVGAGVVFLDLGILFGDAVEPFDAFLVFEPIFVAAEAPFGEVLVGDGFAFEEVGEDLFGFGEVVEPFENGAAEFAAIEAVVEFFADGFGEAGDFAGAHMNNKLGVGWC